MPGVWSPDEGRQRMLAGQWIDRRLEVAERFDGQLADCRTSIQWVPGMNGRDLAKNLQFTQPNIRRLFMLGYPVEVITRQGALDPRVDFIQKPFSPRVLGSKVWEALGG